MSVLPTVEGEVDFEAPGAGKQCKTWFKIIGSLKLNTPPLIALHGGPGVGHEYLNPLTDLYKNYGIPIILYDQVGCGRSTHLQEKMGDASFWTFDLFLQELDNLIDFLKLREKGFCILGHSWGGMLAGAYASRRPEGLQKIILASGPASVPLFSQSCRSLLAELPPDVQKTIEDCDRRGDYESEEYQKAAGVFYARHVCRLDPFPDELQLGFQHLQEDPTSYMTLQGPSEFIITGSFKDWEGWPDAHNIKIETLLTNGRYDEVSDACVEPWFRTISKVRWTTFENSSHVAHFEERERYMKVCGEFLSSASK